MLASVGVLLDFICLPCMLLNIQYSINILSSNSNILCIFCILEMTINVVFDM